MLDCIYYYYFIYYLLLFLSAFLVGKSRSWQWKCWSTWKAWEECVCRDWGKGCWGNALWPSRHSGLDNSEARENEHSTHREFRWLWLQLWVPRQQFCGESEPSRCWGELWCVFGITSVVQEKSQHCNRDHRLSHCFHQPLSRWCNGQSWGTFHNMYRQFHCNEHWYGLTYIHHQQHLKNCRKDTKSH